MPIEVYPIDKVDLLYVYWLSVGAGAPNTQEERPGFQTSQQGASEDGKQES